MEQFSMISQKDIARQCGVSLITVSRALDPLRQVKVKSATRKKILEICAKENFYPNFSARALASGCTRSVGLIVPGIGMISNSPPSAIYLESFNNELEKAGYNMLLLPVSGSDWESISRNAEPLILSNRCDGYVTVAFSVDLPGELPVTVLQTTAAGKITDNRYPVISINNHPAMCAMAEHLKTQQYRKPLFITFNDGSVERIHQWQEAFQNSGFPQLETLNLSPARINYSGDAAMLKVLKSHLEEIKKFDIWVFSNDQWALLAAELMELENISPGKNIAIIGFDNIEKDHPDARISTISPPLKEFGRKAAQTVLEKIKNRKKDFTNTRIELNSQAIFRVSSCKNKFSTNPKEI